VPATRRRRWALVLLLVVLLLIALLLLAPVVAAPWVAGLLVDEANDRLDGRAGVGELSFGWGGGLHVSDLSLADREGAEVLALQRLDAQVDLLSALSGRCIATVRAAGLRLHLRRDATGALNLQTLPRAAPTVSGSAAPAGSSAPAVTLPDVHLDLQLDDGQLVVHDGERATTLDDLRCSLKLDSLQEPAPFELTARITGPDGPGGAVELKGEVTLARDGRLAGDALRARLDLLLQDVLLAALQPAAAVFMGVQHLEGTLSGSGAWTYTGPLLLDGRTELRLAGLRAEGGPLAAPLVVPEARLLIEAAFDEQGSGRQQLELTAGEMLALRWAGRAERLAAPDGSLSGQLSLDARLGPALAAARDALPLQAGLALDGRMKALANGTLRLRDGALAGGEADVELRLADVAAHDAQGAPLELGELTDASLFARASLDAAAGAVRLDRFVLEAGPVYARASGAVGGLPLAGADVQPAALTLSGIDVLAEADLDRLAALLAGVIDSDGLSCGGTVHLASTVSGSGQRLAAVSALDLTNVHVGGVGLDALLPVDLHVRQRGTLDLSAGGRSEIEELSLTANALELRLSGGITDLVDPERRDGRLQTSLAIHTSGAGQTLGPLLGDLRMTGEDAHLQGELGVHGPELSWSGDLLAPSLGAAGGALGTTPLRLDGLTVALQAHVSGPTQPLRVSRLDVGLLGGTAAGSELPELALAASGLVLDAAAGTLDVTRLDLTSALARGGGSLHVSGLYGSLPVVRADLEAVLQPDALSSRFGARLGGLSLQGDPLTASIRGESPDQVHVTLRGGRFEVRLPAVEGGSPQSIGGTGLALDLTLSGEPERLSLAADATVKDLQARLPGPTPREVRDPELRLGVDADVDLPALDVTLRRMDVASTIVSGSASGRLLGLAGDAPRAQGLRGDFRYVPDPLAALLGPLLPVGLSGDHEEPLEFTADGPLTGAGLREQLAGLTLQARLGTGTLDLPGLQLGGTTTVSADDGTLRVGGDLAGNGGTIVLDGALDLRRAAAGAPAPSSHLKLALTGVRTGGELGRVLAACHPLFAPAAGQVGDLDATLDAGVQLHWSGELPLEALLAGALPASLEPLSGTIELELGEVKLAGSPLMSELLASLGRTASPTMTVDRLAIAVEDGRLHYVEPWDVRLAGIDTSFSGSVGLDRTLDLLWTVPVTAELAQKHKVLKRLQGQSIPIPLVGRVEAPELRWSDALADLAGKAALRELQDGLAGKLGGLGGLTGGKDGGDAGAAPAADDPEQILADADALWAANKPDEARPLYKRLKDDFKLTLTYLLNKDRIDERAKKPKK